MGDGERLLKRSSDPAEAAVARSRTRSESTTLAAAVVVAVALGVGLGMWVTARLPPPPSAGAPAVSARLLPEASAAATPATPAPAGQPSPCEGCETTAAGAATPERVPVGSVEEARRITEPKATPDAGAEPAPADEVAAVKAKPEGVTNPQPAASASPDPSRPVAWQVGTQPRAGARANVGQGAAQGAEHAAGAQSEPCVPYASASALSVRQGGSAPLILGGPGVGVRVNVTTPDWSELAVIYEGPAGRNGWLRYSVRSLGRRPGLYTVRFSTPCGSQTIPVTVK